MNAPEDFNRLYANVSDSIGSAMADILSLNIGHKDGKREIGNITDKLRDIQNRFDSELHQLKTQAEWDTFTLAFFGETNAGKSTIIESLRILFKEESRQALLQQHSDDLEPFMQALTVHLEHVREGLHALYSEYTSELTAISQSTDRLTRIAQHEAQERNTIAKAEADARVLLAQQETQARLEAQQQEAAHCQQLAETEAKARQKLAEQESSARLAAEQQEASQRLQIEQANALIAQHEAQERNTIAKAEANARVLLAQQEAQAHLKVQQQEAAHRQQLVETEAKGRYKLAEQESSARLAAEQQETSQRLQIEQANALSRFKVRLALFGGSGILIGATAAVALLKLAGS